MNFFADKHEREQLEENEDEPRTPVQFTQRMPFGERRLSSSPVRQMSPEQMENESKSLTRQSLQQLYQTYRQNPKLIEQTYYFNQMLKENGNPDSLIPCMDSVKIQKRNSLYSNVWMVLLVTLIAIVTYFFIFPLRNVMPHALETCNIDMLYRIANETPNVEQIVSQFYPINNQKRESILHMVSCGQFLHELVSILNGSSHICQFVNMHNGDGKSPLLTQMEIISRLVISGGKISDINHRLDVIYFMLNNCNISKPIINELDETNSYSPLRRCLNNINIYESKQYHICTQLIEKGADLLSKYPLLKNGTLMHDTDSSMDAMQFLMKNSQKLGNNFELLSSTDSFGRTFIFVHSNETIMKFALSHASDTSSIIRPDLNGMTAIGYHLYMMALSDDKIPVHKIETAQFLLDNYSELRILSSEDLSLLFPFISSKEQEYIQSNDVFSSILMDNQYLNFIKITQKIIPIMFIPLHYQQEINNFVELSMTNSSYVCLVLDYTYTVNELAKRKFSEVNVKSDELLSILESVELQVKCADKCRVVTNNFDSSNESLIEHKFKQSSIHGKRSMLLVMTDSSQKIDVIWYTKLNYDNHMHLL
jgi:hypothetical protein